MATLSTVLCTSHSPYIYAPPEEWDYARKARQRKGGIAPDVPVDTPEENASKHARCITALNRLRGVLEDAKPDVVIVLGDDQGEQFDFSNFPSFGVFAGERLCGYKISEFAGLPIPGAERARRPKTPEHWVEAPGHPALARSMITKLVEYGFDVSLSLELPKPDSGIGHAFTRPFVHLAPDFDIPIIPVFVNCYYGPAPRAKRCVQFGRALRRIIDEYESDLRVAVIGSGGLWHFPMVPNTYLDERFDQAMLDGVQSGDADAMAEFFDARTPDVDFNDPESVRLASGGTGMALGYGGGTGETRNWIIACAIAGGLPGTVVDYVPAYASPVGLAFAYWDLITMETGKSV